MSTTEKGIYGEKIASRILTSCGYDVIDRNWRCRFGEIDLVTKKNDILVFVEVKYRVLNGFRKKYPIISKYKLRKLRRTIYQFLDSFTGEHCGWKIAALYIYKLDSGIRVKFCLIS